MAEPVSPDRAVNSQTPDPRPVAEQLDEVRIDEATDAVGGGMGRVETPRNPEDATEGEFTPLEDHPNTPG